MMLFSAARSSLRKVKVLFSPRPLTGGGKATCAQQRPSSSNGHSLTKRVMTHEKNPKLINWRRYESLYYHQPSATPWFSSSLGQQSKEDNDDNDKPTLTTFMSSPYSQDVNLFMGAEQHRSLEAALSSPSLLESLMERRQQRRWMSSITSSSKANVSTTTVTENVQDAKVDDVKEENKAEDGKGMRKRYEQGRENLRNMGESARESYADFREHPRESMKSGAKSLSGYMRQYGPVFIGTYFGVYVTTLASLYAGVESGLLDPAYLFSMLETATSSADAAVTDAAESKVTTAQLVVDWMQNHDFTKPYAHIVEERPYVANLAVAWIACKFTEPIRLPVAVGLTPRVARTLGYTNTNNTVAESTTAEEEQTTTTTQNAEETPDMPASSSKSS